MSSGKEEIGRLGQAVGRDGGQDGDDGSRSVRGCGCSDIITYSVDEH